LCVAACRVLLVLPTDAVAATASGTLPLSGLALDTVTIPELQERMRAGVLTAVELTQAYLDRIAAVNDEVAGVLRVSPHALEEAAHSDAVRAHQGPRSVIEVLHAPGTVVGQDLQAPRRAQELTLR
jgi:amidase